MNDNLSILQTKGKELFGQHFQIIPEDNEVVHKLLTWFLQDEKQALQFGINLNKGILLTGPVGCGKTSLMTLLRVLIPPQQRFGIKSCREITFDFIKDGYEVIQRYSTHAYTNTTNPPKPHTHCFDDMGAESTLKYFGNQCNVMGEILLSRYDHFINNRMITHATTNLSASELESYYGNRVRSRMREMFNLIAFNSKSLDKRR
jgi:energy-coupling factor transporter ATP-binding protein EcfA2